MSSFRTRRIGVQPRLGSLHTGEDQWPYGGGREVPREGSSRVYPSGELFGQPEGNQRPELLMVRDGVCLPQSLEHLRLNSNNAQEKEEGMISPPAGIEDRSQQHALAMLILLLDVNRIKD